MVSALTTKVRNVGKNVAAVYATTLASCIMTMNALANNATGGFTPDATFDPMKNTIGGVIAINAGPNLIGLVYREE